MNRWIQKVVFAALLPLVVMGEEPGFLSKPLVPDDAVVIADFDVWAPDGAPYEGWAAGTVSAGSAAYSVNATGFGGVYDYLGKVDLSGKRVLCLDADVTHGVPGFVVELEDADGTAYMYAWYSQPYGEHVMSQPLDSPTRVQREGSVPGMDWSNVTAMHLQVDDGEGDNSYAVTFNSLYAFGQQEEGSGAAVKTQPTAVSYRTERGISYYSPEPPADDTRSVCKLDLYVPESSEDFATVVWFHAGGLKRGKRYIPGELMRQGFAVAAVSYRLSPVAKVPDYIEDAAAAVAWVFDNIESYGGSKQKIVVAGASAGGYLSTMVGFDKSWLGVYGIDANSLAGIISLSGQAITHVAVREEQGFGRTCPVIDRYAPLHHVRADIPPLLVVTGDRELELLGRYEENAYLMRMLKVAGHSQAELVELEGKDHAGVERPGLTLLLKFMRDRIL